MTTMLVLVLMPMPKRHWWPLLPCHYSTFVTASNEIFPPVGFVYERNQSRDTSARANAGHSKRFVDAADAPMF